MNGGSTGKGRRSRGHDQSESLLTLHGYRETREAPENAELTHVRPGTPGGEYLRRFWHPVALTSEVTDVPLLVRVLGEDLCCSAI